MPKSDLLPATLYELRESDHGGSICLRVGGRVRLDLRDTPSSGFTWHLMPESAPFLQLESEQFTANDPAAYLPGSDGGTLSLVFLATAAGQGELQMACSRVYGDEIDHGTTCRIQVTALAIERS